MPLENNKLTAPTSGIYHAATVCCPDAGSVGNFEYMAGKSIVWTYVPNIWLNEPRADRPPEPGIRFPAEQVNDIWFNTTNCVPFVRMVPRSRRHNWRKAAEPLYSVERIAQGCFDKELSAWGESAKQFGQPLLVEFGAEMNGDWEPWNATYNGKDTPTAETAPDNKPRYLGQKLYRDAYVHIINLFDSLRVENITWFFHVNFNDNPKGDWNRMAGYYPGDEYIDWIGVSCYAAFEPGELMPLKDLLDPAISEIREFSQAVREGTKPIAIAELGAIDYPEANKPESNKPAWIRDSYQLLANGVGDHGPYRNQIKAVSWWDETWWEGPTETAPAAFLRNDSIASSPASVAAYREAVSSNVFIEFL